MTELRVLVAGGGIAGLAAATALTRRGVAVEIVERADTYVSAGAGLYLPANAMRALERLGVGDAVAALAQPIARQIVLDHRGRRLAEIDVDRIWNGVGQCAAIRRGDLHAILREAVADIPVRLGSEVVGLTNDDPVKVTFAGGRVEPYDLVVGADGIHSTVRDLGVGGPTARYVGQVCWRFLATGFDDITDWTVRLGRGRSFLTIALGRGTVYCCADVDTTGLDDPARAGRRWPELFAEFADPVPRLLEHATRAHRAPIEEVAPPAFTAGRVVLVGDAAHACSPSMAQGAAMAVEDALVLAELLTAGRPVELALADYERRRAARVRWVGAQTRRRDRTRGRSSVIRNLTLRLAAERIFQAHDRPLREPA